MVRQDKITYLINFFLINGIEPPLGPKFSSWLSKYLNTVLKKETNSIFSNGGLYINSDFELYLSSIIRMYVNGDEFPIDSSIHQILLRIGIVSTLDPIEARNLMSEFVPYTRNLVLFFNFKKLLEEKCNVFMPDCESCKLNSICDYYNNKNLWIA